MAELLAAAADDVKLTEEEAPEVGAEVVEPEAVEAMVADDIGLPEAEPETEEDEDVEVLADWDALDGKNAAASFGFEDKNPAVTSPIGHPDVQALALQQPMNGGDVLAHVYHRLPVEHC